jgi:hypothetical protein
MSTRVATWADCLSRESTTPLVTVGALNGVPISRPWGALGNWLEKPVLNWNLPLEILEDVKKLCKNKIA